MTARIHIICFGNPLYGDDGAGQKVFDLLKDELTQRGDWQPVVEIFYAGNSGQCAFPYFMGCSYLIIVDAIQVRQGNQPGRVYRLSDRDLVKLEGNQSRFAISSHHLDLAQSWQLLQQCCDTLPELTIFAIEMADEARFSTDISDDVLAASHRVSEEIIRLCDACI